MLSLAALFFAFLRGYESCQPLPSVHKTHDPKRFARTLQRRGQSRRRRRIDHEHERRYHRDEQ